MSQLNESLAGESIDENENNGYNNAVRIVSKKNKKKLELTTGFLKINVNVREKNGVDCEKKFRNMYHGLGEGKK